MKQSSIVRASIRAVLFGVSLIMASTTTAGEVPSAEGLWWADEGSAQVDVREVDGELIGTIVWLREPFGDDGQPLRDVHHPDVSRRGHSVIGLEMLRGFRSESDEPGVWHGGSVYDPANGRTYQGRITLDGRNRLLLRGFIGISLFGRTTTWIRVGSEESPRFGVAADEVDREEIGHEGAAPSDPSPTRPTEA